MGQKWYEINLPHRDNQPSMTDMTHYIQYDWSISTDIVDSHARTSSKWGVPFRADELQGTWPDHVASRDAEKVRSHFPEFHCEWNRLSHQEEVQVCHSQLQGEIAEDRNHDPMQCHRHHARRIQYCDQERTLLVFKTSVRVVLQRFWFRQHWSILVWFDYEMQHRLTQGSIRQYHADRHNADDYWISGRCWEEH
jgi:hypothetical protein